MTYNALPSRAKELFFNNEEKSVGSWINSDIPSQVSAKDGYLSLSNIARDNSRLFYLASMHMLCHSLSQASWFDDDFRKHIWDHGKVQDFFNLVGATKDFDKYANKYGNHNPAAKERESLHKQYENALRRCYDAAYVCYQSRWQTIIQDPVKSLGGIESTLKSDQYKEHWLPTLANPEYEGALPVRVQLAIMQDKLNLLAVMKANSTNSVPDLQRNSSIIDELVACTKATGLVRESFVKPDQEVSQSEYERIDIY